MLYDYLDHCPSYHYYVHSTDFRTLTIAQNSSIRTENSKDSTARSHNIMVVVYLGKLEFTQLIPMGLSPRQGGSYRESVNFSQTEL